ncbi:MAG: hypothetical protein O2795_06505 [Acidobacteria bacterium]|nr:hypothetical protein [Acidobacteriota bacterium]
MYDRLLESENAVGLVALIWLIGSFLLMVRSIRRGRDLAQELATRHPSTYEELGRPRPGYFENVRRTRFAQFVGRREFENLGDRSLAAQFEAYRESEARLLLCIVATGAVIAVLAFAVRHAAQN